MNAIAWLFIGALVGLVNVYSIAWTVVRIRPNARTRAVLTTIGGALLRYGVVAIVLSLALQRSVLSGISAFVGLFVARWIVVYLMNTGRLTWNWARH